MDVNCGTEQDKRLQSSCCLASLVKEIRRDTEEEGCAFECEAMSDDPAGFQMNSDYPGTHPSSSCHV